MFLLQMLYYMLRTVRGYSEGALPSSKAAKKDLKQERDRAGNNLKEKSERSDCDDGAPDEDEPSSFKITGQKGWLGRRGPEEITHPLL
jgi:hypothetical protein